MNSRLSNTPTAPTTGLPIFPNTVVYPAHHRMPASRPKRKVFEHPFEIPTKPRNPKRNHRQERKEAGICRDCPDNAVPGRVRCSACAEKHRVARRHNTVQPLAAKGPNTHPPTASRNETPIQTALPITGAAQRDVCPPQQIKPIAIRPRPRRRVAVDKKLQNSLPLDPPVNR